MLACANVCIYMCVCIYTSHLTEDKFHLGNCKLEAQVEPFSGKSKVMAPFFLCLRRLNITPFSDRCAWKLLFIRESVDSTLCSVFFPLRLVVANRILVQL